MEKPAKGAHVAVRFGNSEFFCGTVTRFAKSKKQEPWCHVDFLDGDRAVCLLSEARRNEGHWKFVSADEMHAPPSPPPPPPSAAPAPAPASAPTGTGTGTGAGTSRSVLVGTGVRPGPGSGMLIEIMAWECTQRGKR